MAVLNKYKDRIPADAVYIGRGSRWGNPYVIGKHGNRQQVIQMYKDLLWKEINSGKITLQELKEFKWLVDGTVINDGTKTSVLGVFSFRAVLNLGMLFNCSRADK